MNTENLSFSPKAPVYTAECRQYDESAIRSALLSAFSYLGIDRSAAEGKRIAVKPNLIMKKSADAAATTHPAVLSALLSILDEWNCADVVIVESSGGPYTESSLRGSYRVCGIEDAAKGHQARLNFDTTSKIMTYREKITDGEFEILTPVADADVLFNLCKLKCHSLTRMSGAIKNTFGTIPGLKKFEMHARYPDHAAFQSMLVDLSSMLHQQKYCVDITDAIVGMEGNGPTGGNPRAIGLLLVSRNPFQSDLIAESVLSCPGEVLMVKEAARRGFTAASADAVPTGGDDWKKHVVSDFVPPDSANHKSALSFMSGFMGGRLYRWFSPYPVIREKTCVGCGECVRSCPVHTILLTEKRGKKKARIQPDACIRCFCCQELCPIHSVDIRRNPILRVLARDKRSKN